MHQPHVPMIDGGFVRPLVARETGDLPVDALAVVAALALAGGPIISARHVRPDSRRLRWTTTDSAYLPPFLRNVDIAAATEANRIHPLMGQPSPLGYGRMHVTHAPSLETLRLLSSTLRLVVESVDDDQLIDFTVQAPVCDILDLLVAPDRFEAHIDNRVTARELTLFLEHRPVLRVTLAALTLGRCGCTHFHLVIRANERVTTHGILLAATPDPELFASFILARLG